MSSAQPLAARVDSFRLALAAIDVEGGSAAPLVDGMSADVVVEPRDELELSAILREAASAGMAVVPYGGATHLGLGNIAEAYDVALSMRRLNAIIAYEPDDMTVTVQAGVKLAELRELLEQRGQLLPLDPPGGAEATVGGVLAANTQGSLRHAYGTARDWVIGMRVAMADGTIVKSGGRVVKNVTGYDLHKLHVGALGTLGIIIEVTFKLVPMPRSQASAAASFPSSADAAQLILRASDSGLALTAAEVLSPAAACEVSGRNAWCALLRFGAGKLAVERSLRDVRALARDTGGTVETVEGEAAWGAWSALFTSCDLSIRVGVPPTALGLLADEVVRVAPGMLSGTASAGLLRASWTGSPPDRVERISQIRAIAARRGGTAVVDSADPETKRVIGDVFGPPRQDLEIMRRLKEMYDPQRILAPGRFFGRL